MSDEPTTAIAQCPVPEKPTGVLADFQRHALSVPVAAMIEGLGEYEQRRDTFRTWLLRQLIEGIHYGVPPGCEPKRDRDGNIVDFKGNVQDPKQWRHKPSLYKAGADFMCDLMGAREEYAADMDAWAQIGSPKDTFVFGCTLYSKATGEKLGHGVGARTVGEKKMGANASLKMAQKSAKVAAVLNAWGLADLFTQDLGEDDPYLPRHENPTPNPKAAPASPRAVRMDAETAKFHRDRLAKIWGAIQAANDITYETKEAKVAAWLVFACKACNCDHMADLAAWTTKHVEQIEAALRRMEGGE